MQRTGRPPVYDQPMQTAASVIGWIIAGSAWLVILASPLFLVVPKLRRLWTAPIGRRMKARRERAFQVAQARRDARTAVLEAELDRLDAF